MTSYDIYVLVLCGIVFTVFTAIFTFMIVALLRYYLKLVKLGAEDENIKIEYEKAKQRKGCADRTLEAMGCAITFALSAVLVIGFITSNVLQAKERQMVGSVPVPKVVMSDSMSYKNKANKHLVANNLNDQVDRFDLVLLHQLPAEEDLELYDIVVYEVDGNLILHRIVGIEEPNEKHPNERWFLLQGDAIHVQDRFPVLYSQMRGIYRGESVPFIGSFFVFMRSPAGMLCIILIIFACVATPIAERKMKKIKDERYAIICPPETEPEIETEEEPEVIDECLKPLDLFKLRSSRKKDIQIFRSRIMHSSHATHELYADISLYLEAIEGIRISYSATYQSFRLDKLPVARLTVKGNAVIININCDPEHYHHAKGLFTDHSHRNSASNYPLSVKINSPYKLELAKTLINDVIKNAKGRDEVLR